MEESKSTFPRQRSVSVSYYQGGESQRRRTKKGQGTHENRGSWVIQVRVPFHHAGASSQTQKISPKGRETGTGGGGELIGGGRKMHT